MSESNKFTPGPWLYRGKSNSVHESCSTHPFGHTIFVFDDDAPLRDPDLSLILSAPDLLEALEGVLRISDLWLPHEVEEQHGEEMYVLHMARNKMIAAVEKARGQQ